MYRNTNYYFVMLLSEVTVITVFGMIALTFKFNTSSEREYIIATESLSSENHRLVGRV